uniref:Uncharacterized protein LOC113798966 n=1 Tax=Dermatophagoides pteronyssinus TaxID=6956 RepID=A0A6P6YJF8_DERPT|nr:uncharacterized protein LOC113798966 [Dermatophagoides pteronyssinus]
MSSSSEQTENFDDKLRKRSTMKLDQNQNPLNNNNNGESMMNILDDNNENGFVNIDDDDDNLAKSQPSKLKNEDSVRKFNESIQALNLWIWQCQTWTYFHGAYQTRIQQQLQPQQPQNNIQQSGIATDSGNQQQQQQQSTNMNRGPVMVVKLSSIRKRLLASMIDYFFILFLFDQFRMLIAELFDYDIPFTTMDFKELETFFPEDDDNLEDLLPKIFWIYIKNIQYSTMFYLFVLIYETLFLFGWPNRTYPGATIGKRIMGLRVVSCDYLESISMATPNIVRIMPAGNITLVKSFFRTLVKLMPINNTIQCFYILTSRYNRSYFDQRIGLIVIDMSPSAMLQVQAIMANATTSNTLQNQQQQPPQQQPQPNWNRGFL